MKTLLATVAMLAGSLVLAADEPAPKPDAKEKEAMKALMLEDAKRIAAEAAKAPSPAAKPQDEPRRSSKSEGGPPAKEDVNPLAAKATPASASKPAEKTPAAKDANAKVAAEPASVLPKVEVTRPRITVLDHELAEQQKAIAREEKLTKPTDLDKALNGAEISKKLSILGGQSADYRAGNASERVRIMKEESDLLEAIAHTKDKKEKEALQKELEELRAYRRELEKNQR